ncbi:MAG: ABC transporter ATP-binding protein [Actinomycetota bacterium]
MILDADDVTVRFGGLVALDSVSLHVDQQEIVGLIGPNGAGKTTFFNALSGVVPVARGTLRVDGHDLGKLPMFRRARLGIGRTLQTPTLMLGHSVLENLVAASADLWKTSTAAVVEQAAQVAEAVGVARYFHTSVRDLPAGVLREVDIARALMTRPKLLLLDEPAAGLHGAEKQRLLTLIANLPDDFGAAVVLIEHDMEVVMNAAHRVYVLDFGRLLAHGSPEQIRADRTVIEAYLGVDVDSDRPAVVRGTEART